MTKKKISILILLIIIIVVVILFVMKRKGMLTKQLIAMVKSTKEKQPKQIVGNPLQLVPSGHRKFLPVNDSKTPESAFGLILDSDLEKYRNKLFRIFADDIILPYTISSDNNYDNVNNLLKDYNSTNDLNTIKSVIKYKHFMNALNVYSMASHRDVDQIYVVILNIIINKIPGDIVEIGVWKGGMSMFMKSIINHYKKKLSSDNKIIDSQTRNHWLFDVFDADDEIYPETTSNALDKKINPLVKYMYNKSIKLQDVINAFKDFNLYDTNVNFIKGLFKHTIPKLKPDQLIQISVLRIDVEYYDDVLYILEQLYFRIVKNGIVVIVNYNNLSFGCSDAVTYFREKYSLTNRINDRYGGSIYWIVD